MVIKELSDDINLGARFLQRVAARGICTQLSRENSIVGRKPEARPVYSGKTYLLPKNTPCSIDTQDLPIKALAEHNKTTY